MAHRLTCTLDAMSTGTAERLARFRNGLAPRPEPNRSWSQRLLRNPWLWACVVATPVYAYLLWHMWEMMLPDDPQTRGNVQIMKLLQAVLTQSFWWALPTLLFWVVIFRFMDRYRRIGFAQWYLALGWGMAVSTFLAIYVNTWAAQQMAVQGQGDPATAAGPAIFVAPFSEEFAKATVLFWLAILVRNRLVSRLQLISLAGLSAAGFAFTENIIYYMRAYLYALNVQETGPDAEAAVLELVWLRGFYTAFGHPLFTMMTAIGLAVALRSKSKAVRVIAPLIGFLAAALLHMIFNGSVTVVQNEKELQNLYYFGALPAVAGAVLTVVFATLRQGRLVRDRLTDFVRMGWLQPHDPYAASRLTMRARAKVMAVAKGWRWIVPTWRLQRRLVELAYLRDGITRGLIEEIGNEREKELLFEVRALRPSAVDDPFTARWVWGWFRRPKPKFAPPTVHPGPAGIGGSWSPPGGGNWPPPRG